MTAPTRTGTRHTLPDAVRENPAALLRKIADGSHPEYDPDGTEHRVWHGSTSHLGYGRVRVPRAGFVMYVHRVVMELHRGEPLPEEMDVDHLCGRRACITPEHLDVVDRATNHSRSVAAQRALAWNNGRAVS